MIVNIIELPHEIFARLTGIKRTQKELRPKFGWTGTVFEVGDLAITLLDGLGYYVHIENREKGKVPNVSAEYATFNTKFTIMDLVKAFFWMDVEEEAKHKPFYWTSDGLQSVIAGASGKEVDPSVSTPVVSLSQNSKETVAS
jgi:hypothetical protein